MILWLPTADEGIVFLQGKWVASLPMQPYSALLSRHRQNSLCVPRRRDMLWLCPDLGTESYPPHSDTSLQSDEENPVGSHLIRETGFWCALWQNQASKSNLFSGTPLSLPTCSPLTTTGVQWWDLPALLRGALSHLHTWAKSGMESGHLKMGSGIDCILFLALLCTPQIAG